MKPLVLGKAAALAICWIPGLCSEGRRVATESSCACESSNPGVRGHVLERDSGRNILLASPSGVSDASVSVFNIAKNPSKGSGRTGRWGTGRPSLLTGGGAMAVKDGSLPCDDGEVPDGVTGRTSCEAVPSSSTSVAEPGTANSVD